MSERILKLGNDFFSKELLNYIEMSPHYNTCLQWNENIDILNNKTYYYSFLKSGSYLAKYLKLDTENKILDKVEDFKNLYNSIKKNGYLKELEPELIRRKIGDVAHYYGGTCCKIKYDGSLELWDGMHRSAIKKSLNIPIEIIIVEEHSDWKNIKEGLLRLHNGQKYLYQSIDHPDFYDWTVYHDNKIKDFLLSEIVSENVLDIGVCHGLTLCRLKLSNRITSGTGIESDPDRFNLAKLLFNKAGLNLFNSIDTFLNQNSGKFNAILLLSVMHHFIRQYGKEKAKQILSDLSKITNKIIYECPAPGEAIINEFGLSGIDFDKFIIEATGFKEKERFRMKRDLIILENN